ncbi:MAG: tetratricopeptide repeat protein [Clostridia bacterium]
MQRYGVREVEKLLGLRRSTIRSLVDAGFVLPQRGPRNAWLFSFQDLIVLRTAQALTVAKVPAKRITRSMRQLKRQLPAAMPLSGLRIGAVADRVVVREGASQWQADSGQYLLSFEGDPANGSLSVIERKKAARVATAGEWFDHAAALEERDPEGAAQAYGQAIALDPTLCDAHLNLGSLLQENGRPGQAELAYREGLQACGDVALLHYNLAVLLDEMGRKTEALAEYEAALSADPRLADGHYNLALLCEELGRPKDAIRHMAQYRRLSKA